MLIFFTAGTGQETCKSNKHFKKINLVHYICVPNGLPHKLLSTIILENA